MIKKKVSHLLMYLFANGISSLAPLLLMPLLTREVSPAVYAELGIFQALIFILTAFVGINSTGYILRYNYEDKASEESISRNISSVIHILMVGTFLVSAILIIIKYTFNQPYIKLEWLLACVCVSACSFLINLCLIQWQVKGKVKQYTFLQASLAILNLVLSFILITYSDSPADGRVTAIVISYIMIAFVSLYFLFTDSLKLSDLVTVHKPNVIAALKYGIPLLPHVIGIFVFTTLDKLILGELVSYESLGYFFVAYQISSIYRILFDAMNKAYVPYLFSSLKESEVNAKGKQVKLTYCIFIIIFCIACIGLYVLPTIVTSFVGLEYSPSLQFLGPLIIGQCFGGCYLLMTGYIYYEKKTWLISKITMFVGGFNLLILIYFCHYYGAIAAAWVFMLTKIIQFLLTFYFANRCHKMPWLKVGM